MALRLPSELLWCHLVRTENSLLSSLELEKRKSKFLPRATQTHLPSGPQTGWEFPTGPWQVTTWCVTVLGSGGESHLPPCDFLIVSLSPTLALSVNE